MKRKEFPPIPESLDTWEFREAWNLWNLHRSEIRKPLTALAVALQFEELQKVGVEAAIVAIRTSIANGWTGLFPKALTPNPSPNSERGEQKPDPIASRPATQVDPDPDDEITLAQRVENMRRLREELRGIGQMPGGRA